MDGVSGPIEGAFGALGLPGEKRMWALMAAVPAGFLAAGDLAGARGVLEAAAGLGSELLPASENGGAGDLEASLWFIRAGHAYGEASGDADFAREVVLPRGKRIVQGVISGQEVGAVRMDDGGMLGAPGAAGLRLNALWYAVLETMAAGLRGIGDAAGDHFERLAGRFRRSFAKAYWCEDHACICVPAGEAQHEGLPAADQVLLSVLPASPIPRTKQRQAMLRLKERGLGEMGVKMTINGEVVESVVHRVWLARALAATAENGAMGKSEAAEVLAGLRERVGGGHGVAAFYREGKALGGEDLLATAELRGGI